MLLFLKEATIAFARVAFYLTWIAIEDNDNDESAW